MKATLGALSEAATVRSTIRERIGRRRSVTTSFTNRAWNLRISLLPISTRMWSGLLPSRSCSPPRPGSGTAGLVGVPGRGWSRAA